MNDDTFSNHIGNSSELTVIANLKQDFVAVPQPLTYAHRLRVHLRMLSALRRSGLETDRAGLYFGPIDSLRTLQFVRWTLIEDDTKMLLSVNFDRAFEPYIRRIVQAAGPLLDSILCNCEGFTPHASDNGFHAFMEYAEKHQVPVELFAAASPNFSVDDADYFLEFDKAFRTNQGHLKDGKWQPKLQFKTPEEKANAAKRKNPLALFEQGFRILRVMAENAWRFPEFDQNRSRTFDDYIYFRLAQTLVPNFWEGLIGWAQAQSLDPDASGTDPNNPLSLINFVRKFPDHVSTTQPSPAVKHVGKLVEDFQGPLIWFAKGATKPGEVPQKKNNKGLIQGGLLPQTAVDAPVKIPPTAIKATHACLLLIRVDEPAKGAAFLALMKQKLWPKTPLKPAAHADGQLLYNLSVTHAGLKSLQIPDEQRKTFPSSFREGMARRAGLLGDVDLNHPTEWEWPRKNWPLGAKVTQSIHPSSIDIMVQIEAALGHKPQAHVFDNKHPLLPEITELAQHSGIELLAVETMHRRKEKVSPDEPPQTVGHLGFVDGKSQPEYGNDLQKEQTPYGDLLLGHKDTLSGKRPYKDEDALLRDGTFQVIRKMQIDVPEFHKHRPVDQAKMVGRNADGSTLSGAPHYQGDPEGAHCPLQSHVRRTNPRKTIPEEEATPRILRRGFSYGPFIHDPKVPDEADRGLFFIAYNANIAEQFEIIQRWISGGNSTNISSWQGDPLLAPKRPGGIREFRYLDTAGNVVSVELPERPIAKLQWGLYGFVPSELGIDTLIELVAGKPHLTIESADLPSIMQTPSPVNANDQKQKWKRLLEDPDETKTNKRNAVWAQVRQNNGAYDTGSSYGTLIGGAENIDRILTDTTGKFSVCEYMKRMKASIGPQYLGLDGGPEYDKESAALNDFLKAFKHGNTFDAAFKVARTILNAIPEEAETELNPTNKTATQFTNVGRRCNVNGFILETLAHLSAAWFGLSPASVQIGGPFDSKNPKPHCPMDFLFSSFYVFGPHPTSNVADVAKGRSPNVAKSIQTQVAASTSPKGNTLQDALLRLRTSSKDPHWDDQKIAEMVAGGVFGFVGPVSGSLRSVMFDWIKEGTLWRLQQRFKEAAQATTPEDAALQVLRPAILKSMGKRPIPDLIYRTKKSEEQPDERIVMSLKSAIDDHNGSDASLEHYLFGGDYQNNPNSGPRHKCPGKSMALTTMMGTIAALFEFSELREEGPLTLWLHK